MDFGLLVYSMPLWLLFVLTTAISIVSVEAGIRLANTASAGQSQDPEGPLGTVVGAVLGLLAFILAFTFGMASTRFDTRKQLVLDNANALSTTYLRAGLLPDSQKREVRRLLLDYVESVLDVKPTNVTVVLERVEDIQDQLWRQAESLTQVDMDSELRSLFVSSLNESLNLHASRKTVALDYRIPSTIWLAVFALMAVSMVIVGYQVGMSRSRRLRGMPIMVLAFSLVILMIADMDRPITGHFTVNQQPLIHVRDMMRKSPPATAAAHNHQ